MTTFAGDLQDDLSEVFFKGEAGEGEKSCTYLPKKGGTLTFPLRPLSGDTLEDRKYEIIYAEEIPVLVNKADLDQPVVGDRLTIDGESWSVTNFERIHFIVWKLFIRKHTLPET